MKRTRPIFLLTFLFLLPFVTGCGTVKIKTKPFDPAYTDWGKVLAKSAYPEGFNFEPIHQDGSELAAAIGSIQSISANDFAGMKRSDQIVFLINAHNMHAVRHVASVYHTGQVPSTAVVKTRLALRDIPLIGRRWSVNQLRAEAMSDRYYESRAIFALNWCMRGNVPLPPYPITAKNYKAYMNRQARQFVRGPGHVEYLKRKNILYVSELIQPYRPALERDYTTLWKYFEAYSWPEDAELIASTPPRIRFTTFDDNVAAFVPEKLPVPVEVELSEDAEP